MNQGVIIDGSFVEVPRQRNTREENKAIKEGRGEELWTSADEKHKRSHKDTDARWTKKGGQKYYGMGCSAVLSVWREMPPETP